MHTTFADYLTLIIRGFTTACNSRFWLSNTLMISLVSINSFLSEVKLMLQTTSVYLKLSIPIRKKLISHSRKSPNSNKKPDYHNWNFHSIINIWLILKIEYFNYLVLNFLFPSEVSAVIMHELRYYEPCGIVLTEVELNYIPSYTKNILIS